MSDAKRLGPAAVACVRETLRDARRQLREMLAA
jgi:hypothetical protein